MTDDEPLFYEAPVDFKIGGEETKEGKEATHRSTDTATNL